MQGPDEFDAFYKDARERLLMQTYALTGDLPAARSAVRDAFLVFDFLFAFSLQI